MNLPTLTDIRLHKSSRTLELNFNDGTNYHLAWEYLRVFSPSAEVRGHGRGQEIIQAGKKNVRIIDIKPVGNYAIQLFFDDGHNSGIYSWKYLQDLGTHHDSNWQDYVGRLKSAGLSRDPDESTVKFFN